MKCPFCNINREKTRIIKRGKYNFVVFSNPRLMPGHLLIIPKRHAEKLSELKLEEKKELLDLTIKFQEKILNNIASGCDIKQNYRPFQKAGRLKVHHLHIHIQPREFKDELYEKCQIYETSIFKKISAGEIEKMISLLK